MSSKAIPDTSRLASTRATKSSTDMIPKLADFFGGTVRGPVRYQPRRRIGLNKVLVGHHIQSSGQRTTRMPESKPPQDPKRLVDVNKLSSTAYQVEGEKKSCEVAEIRSFAAYFRVSNFTSIPTPLKRPQDATFPNEYGIPVTPKCTQQCPGHLN